MIVPADDAARAVAYSPGHIRCLSYLKKNIAQHNVSNYS
jgi:hypothetical protein